MGKYIMALDSGTTSKRCILFGKDGEIVAMAQKEFTQYFPQPGWVEHDPEEIYATQVEVARMALSNGGLPPEMWRPSALPISGKPPLCGTGTPEGRCVLPSCGSAAGRQTIARS